MRAHPIKFMLAGLGLCLMAFTGPGLASGPKPAALFDGKTFRGWEGDTLHTWRIEAGSIVGGSLTETVPHNNFLCTRRSYANFVLRLQVKLVGTTGFVNAGVQFRSQRLSQPAHEMIGYQADIGPKYWASLYDESRRNKTLAQPPAARMVKLVKPDRWNDLEVRCQNRRIQIFLNGQQTVDYTEADTALPQSGLIGLQIHGGGKAQVSYRNLLLTELP